MKLTVFALLLPALFAQAPPTFEVASVKPAVIKPGQRPVEPSCGPGGTYHAMGRGVAASIRFAYNLQPYQLEGVPAWSTKADAAVDIDAKAASDVGEAVCRQMVQALLAERFHLTIRRETKQLTAYAMVVAKSGAKLQKKTDADQGNVVKINGMPAYSAEKGWTMAQLAEYAGRHFPGSFVVDKTGLEGFYKFTLDYEIKRDLPPGDEFAASLERQLGLRLESRKEPVEVVVVERLERPREN